MTDMALLETTTLATRLEEIVGSSHVSSDLSLRELHSQDIWACAEQSVELIVAPADLVQLVGVVVLAATERCPVSIRGAGVSYTCAYLPVASHTISLDMSRMNRILDIDEDNMVVTVQAGCTWAALHAALSARGLRTPFWGPMSGLKSTIGGGLSNLNAMFGAARYGTTSESVVAVTVVLADGQTLRTGARNARGQAFYRHYGPDLAGLFAGDGGVFGVKAEISLRLMRIPAAEGYASFEYATGAGLLSAMADMARAGIASETCAFDPGLARVRMARASMSEDVRVLQKVVSRERSLFARLWTLGRMARAGRGFLDPSKFSLHVICEGRIAASVDADLAEARRISTAHGGSEVESSIARIIRANPFPPLNSILGPGGERWVPVHGIVGLADATEVFAELVASLDGFAAEFDACGITVGHLFTSLSTNALILEPVFYWPESRFALHEATIEPVHLARLPVLASNPEATAMVEKARQALIDVFSRHGCAHFQIGRTYPYLQSRDQASVALLDAIKQATDGSGRLNPGGLGLSVAGGMRLAVSR